MGVLAPVAGAALYALAFPPFDVAAAGWLTLVPVLLAVRRGSVGRAFVVGAGYGFLSGWVVTWWLAQAVARYFDAGLLVAALAMSGAYLIAVASAFGLFGAGACVLLRRERPPVAALGIAALWAASECLRGRILEQPWALLGYSQHAVPALIQVAAATGVYGVSFLLALGNAGIAEALVRARRRCGVRAALAPLGLPAALAAAVAAGGALRVQEAGTERATYRVAVVQTNVPPAFRWTRAYADRVVAAHVAATEALPPRLDGGLVVWPENAVPRYLETDPGLAAALAGVAARLRRDLLFGAPRHADGHTYNSVRLLTAAGRNGGHYDKQHLVLFAEASPLAGPVPAAPSESPRAFTAGTSAGVLRARVPLGVSICHEILYPEIVDRAVRDGAALLVNVSNDGWLDGGFGIASRQHFAMAVFRAVETRRYLVRAATTGVSGVVDPWGRVVSRLPAGTAGVATARVAARGGWTPYVAFGDAFALGCALVGGLLCGRRRISAAALRLRPVPSFSGSRP